FRDPRDAWLLLLTGVHAALVLLPSPATVAVLFWWNANALRRQFVHRRWFRRRALDDLASAWFTLLLGVPQRPWRQRHLAPTPARRGACASKPASSPKRPSHWCCGARSPRLRPPSCAARTRPGARSASACARCTATTSTPRHRGRDQLPRTALRRVVPQRRPARRAPREPAHARVRPRPGRGGRAHEPLAAGAAPAGVAGASPRPRTVEHRPRVRGGRAAPDTCLVRCTPRRQRR